MKRLREVINGDSRDDRVEITSKYRSGPELISLFTEYGRNDRYADGFPSRWAYTDECLSELNGGSEIAELIEHILDPLDFDDAAALAKMVEYINPSLERDGWRLVTEGGRIRLRGAKSSPAIQPKFLASHAALSREFVDEHIEKCRTKLESEDYSGAVTNARSLVETVLVSIEQSLTPAAPKYDGDLPKLQKRVHKLLSTGQGSETDAVIQFLRGLAGVVSGLSGTSNVMGDRHSGHTVRAQRRHARLAVHAAFALCDFYVEALEARPVATPSSPSR